MLLDVFVRRFNAHVRQSGPPKVELAKLCAIYLESIRFPVAVNLLLQLSGGFTPSFRIVEHLASRRLHRFFSLGNLTRNIGSINFTRVRFQGVGRAHTVNYAIIS